MEEKRQIKKEYTLYFTTMDVHLFGANIEDKEFYVLGRDRGMKKNKTFKNAYDAGFEIGEEIISVPLLNKRHEFSAAEIKTKDYNPILHIKKEGEKYIDTIERALTKEEMDEVHKGVMDALRGEE